MELRVMLTENEIKVLKQITSLKYISAYPKVDMDFVASKTNLTFEQVDVALMGLHKNIHHILKAFDKKEHVITIEISENTYKIANMF